MATYDEICERLTNIEHTLEHELKSVNDLLQEVVRSNLKNTTVPRTVLPRTETTTQELYFRVRDIANEYGDVTSFEVSGRTYDIRDRLKNEFSATWNNDTKAWLIENIDHKDAVLEFLQSLTTKISIIS
jgi:hypothetical protein